MFTGIVEAKAKVLETPQGGLALERPASFTDIKVGSSISVAGVCLSVVSFDEAQMRFDIVPETYAKSRLGELTKGASVNLERSMKAGDRVDGHVVQGHVEGTGEVVNGSFDKLRRKIENNLSIRLPHELLKNVVEKGSIAIDGVSLTVAKIDGDVITIALIPHTLEHTTLGTLQKGDHVNIETDVLMRGVR
jgi:riboflavin synthase